VNRPIHQTDGEAAVPAPQETAAPILAIEGLEQRLEDPRGHGQFTVLVEDRLTVCKGDFVAILGPSGCGKTTLLTVLGLLRRPSNVKEMGGFTMWAQTADGPHEIDLKQAWLAGNSRQIEALRRKHVGFALQSGELLTSLTVQENIASPLRINGAPRRLWKARVQELLDAFDLHRVKTINDSDNPATEEKNGANRDGLATSRVNQLSGGEYQRVSLARAIAHQPHLVFVDEPTAALNRELARDALNQFRALQQQRPDKGATIMITHDEQLAGEFANVTIRMAPLQNRPAGRVVEVVRQVSGAENDKRTADPANQSVTAGADQQ